MFKEVPAINRSIWMRRLIHDTGINDSWYQVNQKINGKNYTCPFYRKWKGMLERCYSDKCHKKHPTYIGCSVVKEWLTFSNFKAWMIKQDWHNKELDKDIKFTGSKIYSPDTCIFVTQEINLILIDNKLLRGDYPQGVTIRKSGRFCSRCSVDGKRKSLGMFDTSEEASQAYKEFKSKHVKEIAIKQEQPLRGYLMRIAGEINP